MKIGYCAHFKRVRDTGEQASNRFCCNLSTAVSWETPKQSDGPASNSLIAPSLLLLISSALGHNYLAALSVQL